MHWFRDDGRVPHISLVFRRCGIPTTLTAQCFGWIKSQREGADVSTSREKRARLGTRHPAAAVRERLRPTVVVAIRLRRVILRPALMS